VQNINRFGIAHRIDPTPRVAAVVGDDFKHRSKRTGPSERSRATRSDLQLRSSSPRDFCSANAWPISCTSS
jgi:hypothetical protein